MIKNRGGDFSKGSTTLACGACCCCTCCLQSVVTGYYFGKAGRESLRDSWTSMGKMARVLLFAVPAAGVGFAVRYFADKNIGLQITPTVIAGITFLLPVIVVVLGMLSWIGAGMGTILDADSPIPAANRREALRRFGDIIAKASGRSLGFGILAFIVSIPGCMAFADPTSAYLLSGLVVIAVVKGWFSKDD